MNAIGMMSGPVVLMPAYGKSYKTAEEAIAAWNAGQDFKIVGGSYCSVRDMNYLVNHCSTIWIDWNRIDSVRVY